MSTPPERHIFFANLCHEIRLMIWEVVIGPPSVHRIYGGRPLHLASASASLIQSTTTARAALSVSRVDRDIILQWILPDEIPFDCERISMCRERHGVLRYNAAKDIICFIGMIPETRLPKCFEAMDFTPFYHASLARVAWIHTVEKIAMDFGIGGVRLTGYTLLHDESYRPLARFCSWFRGLKRFYVIYKPLGTWMHLLSWCSNGYGLEVFRKGLEQSQESLLGELDAPIPFCDEGKNSESHYAGTSIYDVFLQGMAAVEWLYWRQNNKDQLYEIEQLNKRRAKLLHQCREMANESDPLLLEKKCLSNLRVGVLLRIDRDRRKI
ncbi:hypothetical protein ACHAQJ_001846 [Trichoderma viride]